MNRRDFLRSATAAVATVVSPARVFVVDESATGAGVMEIGFHENVRFIKSCDYIAFAHRDNLAAIRALVPGMRTQKRRAKHDGKARPSWQGVLPARERRWM